MLLPTYKEDRRLWVTRPKSRHKPSTDTVVIRYDRDNVSVGHVFFNILLGLKFMHF